MNIRRDYRTNGVAVARGVLDAAAITDLAGALEENLAAPGPWASEYTPAGGTGRFFGDYVNWQRIAGYRHAALLGALPALAAELVDGPVRFFHEHALVKEPGTTETTPWHHDEPYYCVDGAENVSLWVPLDPVPAGAGVRFVVGSHHWDRRFVPRRFADHVPYATATPGYELVPDVEREVAEHDIVSFDVEPGDVVAFHFRTLHSAPGTAGLTANRRRVVSFRYVGGDARMAARPWLHSPPFEPVALGAELDDEWFPRIDASV